MKMKNFKISRFIVLLMNFISVLSCLPKNSHPKGYCPLHKIPTQNKDENFLTNSCEIEIDKAVFSSYINTGKNKSEQLAIPRDIPENVMQVQINNKKIQMLPAGVFQHLQNCTKMDLSKNEITTILSHAFRGLYSLTCLDLSFNQIQTLQGINVFSDLSSLQALYLSKYRKSYIHKEVLYYLSSLKSLKIDGNCVRTLLSDNFKRLSNLIHLDLSLNPIQIISSDVFRGLFSLQSLNFERTEIYYVQCGSFDHLTALKYLNLGYNGFQPKERNETEFNPCSGFVDYGDDALYNVERNLFEFAGNLEQLILTENNISDIPADTFWSLNSLILLDLSKINLNATDKDLFRNSFSLKALNLSGNHIDTLLPGTFIALKTLIKLDLSYNSLTTIHKETCKGLHSLSRLYLHGNDIKEIQPETLANVMLNNFFLTLCPKFNFGWNVFTSKDKHVNKSLVLSSWNIKLMFPFDEENNQSDVCWMTQAVEEGWLELDTKCSQEMNSENIAKHCKGLTNDCPAKVKCVDFNECTMACPPGYEAIPVTNYEVCPFEHICQCVECTKKNCSLKCLEHEFEMVNITTGCPECSCICPDLECDSYCGGTGIGIPGSMDEVGCATECVGCMVNTENGKLASNETLPGLASGPNYFTIGIIVPVVALAVTCGLLIIFFRRKRIESEEDTEVNQSDLQYLLSKLNEDLKQQVEECWIEPNNLRIGHLLGNGNFGIVWSGKLFVGLAKEVEIAIKKIKGTYKDGYEGKLTLKKNNEFDIFVEKIRVEVEMENQQIEDFLQEAVIMRKFNHPNVLSLIGISTHGDRPCAILPLMTNGDLKKYLDKKGTCLSIQEMLSFSLGVAKGMEHIAEQKFVHRDLAARNCMLDSDLMVKIADFGLMRNLSECNEYKIEDRKRALPVRWMSIEALEDGVFTLENDVWSYGVLLWEIFSCGRQPYHGIDNADILHHLKQGKRLLMIEKTTECIYELMLECWSHNPKQRPTFSNILLRLNNLADSAGNYLSM